jgi:hypothetical protein
MLQTTVVGMGGIWLLAGMWLLGDDPFAGLKDPPNIQQTSVVQPPVRVRPDGVRPAATAPNALAASHSGSNHACQVDLPVDRAPPYKVIPKYKKIAFTGNKSGIDDAPG